MEAHTNSQQNQNDTARQLVYHTRFGEVSLREDRLISFPQGVLGFGDCTTFGLSRIPNVDESPMMLLQCITDPEVCFIVADPAALGVEIAEKDHEKALKETGFSATDTQMLVILTLYDNGDSYYMTANTKAPLFIDSAKRVACQHILESRSYSTQHKV